jgi:hypothetical protein
VEDCVTFSIPELDKTIKIIEFYGNFIYLFTL